MADKKAISSNKKSTHPEPQAKKSNLSTTDTIKQYLPLIAVLAAEFIGTFLLVAATFAVQGQPLFVAFALVGIILVVSGVANVHLNPAMTIGALVTKKIKPVYAVGYIVAQLLGAVAAYFMLKAFLGGVTASATTTSQIFHAASIADGKQWYVFFAELLGSIILGLGIAAAIKSKDRIVASVAYGFSLLIAVLIAGSATAVFLTESNTTLTFLNPATAVAADALKWEMWPIAIYIVAPVIGAIIGFALQDLLKSQVKNKN